MKNLQKKADDLPVPQFWGEGWLEKAKNYLDKAQMTPEQRMMFEVTMAKSAVVEQHIEERIEEREKLIAKKMKEQGISIELILAVTSLTKEEIELL